MTTATQKLIDLYKLDDGTIPSHLLSNDLVQTLVNGIIDSRNKGITDKVLIENGII